MNGGGAVVRLFFFVGISKRYNFFTKEISWDGTNFIVYIKVMYNIQWVYAQV